MKVTRILVGLGLMALVPLSFAACGGDTEESSQGSDDEATTETEADLDSEDPWPGPGGLPPGGHDPGGPGYGWGGGWCDDPQYAPYCHGHGSNNSEEQRRAKQREYDRIREENRRHSGGGGSRQAPADTWINCRGMNPVDCMMKCGQAGAACTPIRKHPNKPEAGIGELYMCKNGGLTSTCSYHYANGDECVWFRPFGWFPICVYVGGKH